MPFGCAPYPDPLFYAKASTCSCCGNNNTPAYPCNVQGKCVFYSGANLPYLGVYTADSLDTALYKINAVIASLGSGSSLQVIEFQIGDGQPITPIAGTNSFSLSLLAGVTYAVFRNGSYQYRTGTEKNININPSGGFALAQAGDIWSNLEQVAILL
jgi:hypothetical protein